MPPQYDVEELAEQGDFNDSAYLLLHGELPTPEQKALFDRDLTTHSLVHEQLIMCAPSPASGQQPVGPATLQLGARAASSSEYVGCMERYAHIRGSPFRQPVRSKHCLWGL